MKQTTTKTLILLLLQLHKIHGFSIQRRMIFSSNIHRTTTSTTISSPSCCNTPPPPPPPSSSSANIILYQKTKTTSTMKMTSTEGSSSTMEEEENEDDEITKQKKREKVMSFLRKVGAVGNKKDFATAIGVDEGPVGKNNDPVKKLEKSKAAYKWCSETGIIDDMTETFPLTSSGSEWAGFTDSVMGGVSTGICTRETIHGRPCNLMKGKVSLYNNGGFIQMATALSTNPALSLNVDARKFDGVELDVLYKGDEEEEKFNIHLRNPACLRQFSSYRGSFRVKNGNDWETVRIPFNDFVGYGPGSSEVPFDVSELRRLGIVAIGKKMDVYLAVAGVRFYKD